MRLKKVAIGILAVLALLLPMSLKAELPKTVRDYFKNGCFEKAKDYLLEMSRRHPHSKEINRALAQAYLFMAVKELWKLGTVQDLQKIKQLLAINDSDPISLYYLGKAEWLLKNKEAALRCLEKAFVLDPGYTQAALDLALLYEAEGEYKKARQTVETFLQLKARDEKIKTLYMEELLKRFSWEEDFLKIPPAKVPLNMIELPPGRKCLLVDKEKQRLLLYLVTPKGLQLKHIFPCTTGRNHFDKFKEGDNNTPEGVYFLTKAIEGTALERLGGDYGNMAFVLNFPNVFDHFLNKDGHGIWLHGTNSELKPWLPQTTHGCVVMSNADLLELSHAIRLNQTPLIITKKINWVSSQELENWRQEIRAFLKKWKQAWENKDFAIYATCYAPNFHANGFITLKGWLRHKCRLAKLRKHIKISLEQIEIYFYNQYPSLGQVVMVRCLQKYTSDNYKDEGIKTLFLVKKTPNSPWQILLEHWEELP